MRGIYRFNYWQDGTLSGTFADDSQNIANAFGRQIYVKSSLTSLEEEDIIFVTDDPVAVNVFDKFGLRYGINPMDHIICTECNFIKIDCKC